MPRISSLRSSRDGACGDLAENRRNGRLVQADRLVDHEPEPRKGFVDLRALDSAFEQTVEDGLCRGTTRPRASATPAPPSNAAPAAAAPSSSGRASSSTAAAARVPAALAASARWARCRSGSPGSNARRPRVRRNIVRCHRSDALAKSPLCSISRSNAATQPSKPRPLAIARTRFLERCACSFGMQSRPSPSEGIGSGPGRSYPSPEGQLATHAGMKFAQIRLV